MLGELRLALGQILPRIVDDAAVQAEPCGHLERQAPAGRSVEQMIRGLECIRRKSESRSRDARRRGPVGFERIIMRRRQHDRAARAEMFDDGHAQRAALERIGPGAHFVEQHKRG